MYKPIVAVDMDDTLVWLMKAIMEDHNRKYPMHAVKYSDMAAFQTHMFHPDYDKMEFFAGKETFFNLELMDEYVVPEMKKLHDLYEVWIVTSAFPEAVYDKWRWVQKYLPFIPYKNFFITQQKDKLAADILIDDAIHNVQPWAETGRPVIVPSHHWNQELRNLPLVTMVDSWNGMADTVTNIFKLLDYQIA